MVCLQPGDKRENCSTTSRKTKDEHKRKGVYVGESSRSLYERVGEHVKAADTINHEYHMVKHWLLDHKDLGRRPPFKLKILVTFMAAY